MRFQVLPSPDTTLDFILINNQNINQKKKKKSVSPSSSYRFPGHNSLRRNSHFPEATPTSQTHLPTSFHLVGFRWVWFCISGINLAFPSHSLGFSILHSPLTFPSHFLGSPLSFHLAGCLFSVSSYCTLCVWFIAPLLGTYFE